MSLGTKAVDLDGTLAMYDGWKGPEHIGPPVPVMVARVQEWLSMGYRVVIFTARVCHLYLATATEAQRQDAEIARSAIQKWCKAHIGCELPVTAVKTFDVLEVWDDRAVGVIPNTGIPLTCPDSQEASK